MHVCLYYPEGQGRELAKLFLATPARRYQMFPYHLGTTVGIWSNASEVWLASSVYAGCLITKTLTDIDSSLSLTRL